MDKNLKKSNGFTLAELLIVVAIIGVLVAIAIPVFSSQLNKAKAAVDMANIRSAKAAGAAAFLS
ncbi:MAG: type IV pilin protein [Bilifractor sp.]